MIGPLKTAASCAAAGAAAAMTYVAARITSILTLLYYVMRFTGGSDD